MAAGIALGMLVLASTGCAWLGRAGGGAGVPGREEGAGCLRRRGGCPVPAAAGSCLAQTEVLPFTAVLAEADKWLGQMISVRGPLRQTTSFCTTEVCAKGECCNTCEAALALSDGDVSSPLGAPGAILLVNDGDSVRYSCRGDDSLVCCGIDARGQEVIAVGILEAAANPGTYQLGEAAVCAP
ncbi:MAG: hypothetical protein V2A73_19080 [Pseudomonadota bacterium]